MKSFLLVGVAATVIASFVLYFQPWMPPKAHQRTRRRLLDAVSVGRHYHDPRTMEIKPATKSMLLPDNVLYEIRLDFLPLCDYFKPEHQPQPARLSYHFPDCSEDQLGNRLGEHYGRYALANAAGKPYTMTCGDFEHRTSVEEIVTVGTKVQHLSVLKLLQVNLMEPGPVPTDSSGKVYTAADVCRFGIVPNWHVGVGVDLVSDTIREDMWKIANSEQGQSFVPDDVVIHLRLGDVLFSFTGEYERQGLLPHRAYSQLIERAIQEKGLIRTISIVTMPFNEDSIRSFDRGFVKRSKMVADDLVKHLESKFPDVSVTIHNGRDEPPSKSYARLTRAKKAAICGPATFCSYPVLGNRDGLGFIFYGSNLSPWVPRAAEKYENIHAFQTPALGNNYIEKLTDRDLLSWLNEQDPNVAYQVITEDPLFRYTPVAEFQIK